MGLRRPEGQCSHTSLDTGGAATAEKTLLGDPPPVPSYFNVGLGIRPHAALHPSVRCWAGPSVRPPRGGDWMWVVFPPGVLARCVYWHLRFLLNQLCCPPRGPPTTLHQALRSPLHPQNPSPSPGRGHRCAQPPICWWVCFTKHKSPHRAVGVGSWRRELRYQGRWGQPGVEQGGQRTRGIRERLGSGVPTALGFRRWGWSRLCPPSLPL